MGGYDIIVIGGGANGLTLASYLQKAGARVLVVERRYEMGGGLLTEDFAGFRFNIHATYMMFAEFMPPYSDLNLAQYGVRFIRPEVQLSLIYEGDKSLTLYTEPQKSADKIATRSRQDASRFLKMHREFKEACDECLIPSTYVPPAPPGEYASMLSGSAVGRRVLAWSEMSPLDVLESYGIRDEQAKAAILYVGCIWGLNPTQKGIGHIFPLFAYRMLNAALVTGGSHRLSSALLRPGYENGLEVMENTTVTKIIVEDGYVKGVLTDSGTRVEAKVVVSTVDPWQTFMKFVGREKLEKDLIKSIRDWKWEDWTLFIVHLGLKGKPKLRAGEKDPDCDKALLQMIGYQDVDDVLRHWDAATNGNLPGAEFGISPISMYDAAQSPPGYEIYRVETQTPYQVKRRGWDKLKDEYAKKLVDVWLDHLVDASDVRIVKQYVYPPSYIDLKLIDMVRGSIKQGAYIPSQMGYYRPNEKCSNYGTPIKGLYIAGASAYPGGMVSLGPGYAAARRIAKDLGLRIWWDYPDYIKRAKERNLIP